METDAEEIKALRDSLRSSASEQDRLRELLRQIVVALGLDLVGLEALLAMPGNTQDVIRCATAQRDRCTQLIEMVTAAGVRVAARVAVLLVLLLLPTLADAQTERIPTDPHRVWFRPDGVADRYVLEWRVLGGAWVNRVDVGNPTPGSSGEVEVLFPVALQRGVAPAVDYELHVVAIEPTGEELTSAPVTFCRQEGAPKGQSCAKAQALSTRKSRVLRWLGL